MTTHWAFGLLILMFGNLVSSEEAFCDNLCYAQGVVTSRECYCDAACGLAYGDCCSDAKHFDKSKVPSNTTRNLICISDTLVVKSCLKEWKGPDFITNSCLLNSKYEMDPVGNALVTSDVTGLTYSNYYCAICNGDAEKLVMWNIKVSCPFLNSNLPVQTEEALKYLFYNHPTKEWGFVVRDNNTKKSSFYGCAISYDVPKSHRVHVRQCEVKEVRTCAQNWKKDAIREMCHSYTDPVFSKGIRYKNFYCAVCNRVDLSNMTCGEGIGPRKKEEPESDKESNILMSFTMLLDLNTSKGNIVGKNVATQFAEGVACAKGQVYDPFATRCRNIVCGIPGYILENGMCFPAKPPEL